MERVAFIKVNSGVYCVWCNHCTLRLVILCYSYLSVGYLSLRGDFVNGNYYIVDKRMFWSRIKNLKIVPVVDGKAFLKC